MKLVRLALIAATWGLCSCGPAATEGGFDSANPAAKMYAIEYAARDGDRSAVKNIVEQLGSDDPAVRSLAIAALQRLTGQTLGYRDFDEPHVREQAIERWRIAVERGIPADEHSGIHIDPNRSDAESSSHG
jgi:hypothetical protein